MFIFINKKYFYMGNNPSIALFQNIEIKLVITAPDN